MIRVLQRSRPLVVSIDWDYFLPRPLEEFNLSYDPGRFQPFLSQVFAGRNYFHLRVCESHQEIVDFTKDLASFDIINFDAHQDVNYGGHDTYLNCGNWAGYLRDIGQMRSYTLVYPSWRIQHPEREDGWLPGGIDRVVYGNWPDAPLAPFKVFVCRSSPWMPSWCDEQWLQLIAFLTERPMLSTMLDEEVLQPRRFDLPALPDRTEEPAAARMP
jgi:hypothetical protein